MVLQKNPNTNFKERTRRSFELSVLLSLILVISAFRFFPRWEKERIAITMAGEVVKIEDIANTRQEQQHPPPPRPPILIENPTGDTSKAVDLQTDFNPNLPLPRPSAQPVGSPDLLPEEQFFEVVETQPELIGGDAAIREHLVYPTRAIRAGIEGSVVIFAYVDRTGEVKHVELVKGIGGGCDEAALEAVQQVRFIPGRQRGKPVKVRVAVTVRFRLK